MAVLDEAVALGDLDAVGQAAAVRRGEIDPADLAEVAIERIERADPVLGVLVTSLFDDARRRLRDGLPRGPFTGVPLLVKDFLCATEGDPYFAGSKALHDRCWRAKRSSHLAARLRQAGFVILGRTNTPEFALQLTTEPLAFGATRNPWSLSHSPGGSSGGSAAAVAAGLVAVAHGNDGAGSIRVPASACGLVGLKPSRGRTSLGPDVGESLGLHAVEGALTRSVRDTAAMLDVMAGAMPGDPCVAPPPRRPYAAEVGAPVGRLRIGFVSAAPDGIATHPDCVAAVTIAATLLAGLGHDVQPASGALLATHEIEDDLAVRNAANVAAALDGWSARTGHPIAEGDVEPTTWELAQRGRCQSAARLARALGALQTHGRALSAWLEEHYDLLLSPTMAEPPPRIGELRRHEDPMWPVERARPLIAFTLPFNISGQPAISLPLHCNAGGLPIGVQLAAAYGREDLLLRVASQLEAAQPWAHRRPNPIEEF
jgi:amidase